MIQASIFEAKTQLSELIKRARKGDEVIITSGRSRTPVVRIQALDPVPRKRLGLLETPGFALTPAFYEPLPGQAVPVEVEDEAE